MEDNDKDDNNFKDISAQGLDRDLVFLRGHQGNQPHNEDDDDKEEDDEKEDNNKKDNTNKDDNNKDKDNKNNNNNDNSISALGLVRDLRFL